MRRLGGIALSLGLLLGLFGGPMASPTNAASLKICGEVTAYVEATAVATGLLTINGIPLVIAAGASLPASVAVGADICANLTTDAEGRVSGATVTANAHAEVKVCGEVTAHAAATATTTGLLRIAGHAYTLALGSSLPASVDVGDDLCLDLEVDGFGRVADGTVTANAHARLKVCGTVTAYAEATSTTTGKLRIGSRTWTLAVLSDLPASVRAGADLCIDLELDGYGRVSDGEVAANVQSTVKVCGTVTAYVAATATTLGQLKIAGRTRVVALAASLPASVRAGADLCLDLRLNGFLQVKDGTAVANVEGTLEVCGQVTAYAAPSATADGSLTVGGVARTIRAGAQADGAIQAGAYLKLRLTTDVFARIATATIVKVGVSLADACGDPSASPSPGPDQSPDPGQSPGPDQSPDPGQSPGPDQGQDPTQDPGQSHDPSGGVGGIDTCAGSGTGGSGANHDGETLLPSTDALGRATGVIVGNAIPLLAIGLLGGLAAWYRSRRNVHQYAIAEDFIPGTGDLEDPTDGPDHDGSSEHRS